MASTGTDATYPSSPVLMRVGLRAGVVLAGKPSGGPVLTDLDQAGARLVERSEEDLLIAFGPGEPAAFRRAARMAAGLRASVPPVAVALHAPCAEGEMAVEHLTGALALAQPGDVLATEAFWRMARDHFAFEALPDRLFRLGPPKVALPDVFVGRASELEQLRSCWETARLGRPLLVSIQGEAGIGKSRFLDEFLATEGTEPHLYTACCRQNEQQRPYAMLSSFLSALGFPVGRLCEELGTVGADLDYLLGGESQEGAVQPRHRQFRAFRGLNRILLERLGAVPALLVLEDVHWADEASLSWLDSLVAELAFADRSPPWLLVFTERGREVHRRHARMGLGAIAISLAPLSEAEAEGLLGALLPGEPTLCRAVHERAGGSPLYLREFAHLAQVRGKVDAMPESVRWQLQHRLEALSPVERQVLEIAAVLGATFDLELLRRLVPFGGFKQVLANLAGAGLVIRGAETAAFGHHLLHEAAYEAMPAPRRRELHAMVAHSLEAGGAEAGMVAHHYLKGPRPAQARPHLLKAARMARERHALAEAKQLLRQAARAGGEADAMAQAIRLELSEVLLTIGELGAARKELVGIRSLVSDDDRVRLALLQSQLDERRGEYAAAVAALSEAAAHAAAPDALARLLLAEAALLLRQGQFAACRELAERALIHLAETPSLERAMAHSLQGIALYRLAGPEQALIPYRTALSLREQVGEPAAIAGSLSNLGIAHYELGRWDEALSCFDRALETFRSIGERWPLTVALNNRGHLLLNRGDVDAAEACYREALTLKREMGEEPGIAIALCNLGNALSRRGARAEARTCLQEAVLVLERLGEQETLAEVYQVYGMVELAADDRHRARLLLERSLDKSNAVRREGPRAIALRGLSQLAAQEERWEEAALYAWESVELNDRLQNPLELGRSLMAWAIAQAALGDPGQARDAREKARVLFRQLGALPDERAVGDLLG